MCVWVTATIIKEVFRGKSFGVFPPPGNVSLLAWRDRSGAARALRHSLVLNVQSINVAEEERQGRQSRRI